MKFRNSDLRAAKIDGAGVGVHRLHAGNKSPKRIWRSFRIFPTHDVMRHLGGMAADLAQQSGQEASRQWLRGQVSHQRVARLRREVRRGLERAAIKALAGRTDFYCLTFSWRGGCFALCARYCAADRVTVIEIGLADHPLPQLETSPYRKR